jgi:hypothetical protein
MSAIGDVMERKQAYKGASDGLAPNGLNLKNSSIYNLPWVLAPTL